MSMRSLLGFPRAAGPLLPFAALLLGAMSFTGCRQPAADSGPPLTPVVFQGEGAPAEATAAAARQSAADPLDWTFCRGPEGNGISRETGLPDSFNPDGGDGSNLLWKQPLAAGRSTPIVMNGRLYTLCRSEPETPREGEMVICLDAATGEVLWKNRFNVWLSDVPDTRVGWSSVVGDPETGNVYALGVCGYFQCINGETGETIWSNPLHESFGLLSTYGGRTNFPIVCDDLVIISGVIIGWGEQARPNHRFIGMDKRTGEVVWFSGTTNLPEDTTYSTPILTVLGGQKVFVTGSGDGNVWAFQPRTGRPVWQYALSRRGVNSTPVIAEGKVYIGQSEENVVGTTMGALVAIAGDGVGDVSRSKELWKIEQLMNGKNQPVLLDGVLYVLDDSAKFWAIDAAEGKPLTSRGLPLGTIGRASPLYADGKFYVLEANGRWYVLEPDSRRGATIAARGRFPTGEECHASPIVSHGRLYIQTTGALYCFHDAAKEHGVTPAPTPVAEPPVEDDPKPAHLQLVPAESLLGTGEQLDFRGLLYNSRGQFLGEAKNLKLEVEGPGQVSAEGRFTAPSEGHTATILRASADGLRATARLRTVPPLPWKFDFEGLSDPPITWVGARYRHVMRQVDGSQAMVKITTIPKGTRSRCFFGPSHLSDYTITAEVKGATQGGKQPDIGVIAQGYCLDMQGDHQKLQVRTWDPQLRMAKTIDFPWQPDVWYTLKLRAEVRDGQAVLQGKVWPKGEQEPAEWTITAVDPTPQTAGSPGLFGNATDAEIFIDNVTVEPNKS